MVQRYWGAESARPEDYAALVRPEEGGIRTDELAARLRSRGWRTLRVDGDLEKVAAHVGAGRPVVLLLQVGPGRYHYVVVVAVTGTSVLLHDPARAPYRRLPREELERRWAAADRWGLVIVPGWEDGGHEARGGPVAVGDLDAAGDTVAASGPPAEDSLPQPCAEPLRAGIEAASSEAFGRADSLLAEAVRRCPEAPGPRRERAGLRFRQERWREAAESAREALERDPTDELARRILASSLYLSGAPREALHTWNVLGEPRLVGVRAYGLRRTRYRVLREQMGIAGGALLTPERLAAVRRRVAAVPAFSTTRVGLRAPAGGKAELEAAVAEGSVLPTSPRDAGVAAIRAVASEELSVAAVSPAGVGERWNFRWRWQEGRPRLELSLAAPGAFGVPGVWTALGSWARETYGVRSAASGPPASEGTSGEGTVESEERRRARLARSRWASGRLRLEAGAGLDDWTTAGAPGARLALEGAAELRDPGDRAALLVGGTAWTGSGEDFARARIGVAARTRPRAPVALSARAGLVWTSPGTPRTEWPGAGTGKARTALLRAHPLHEDGVIRGEAFGQALAHASAELSVALPRVGPLRPRLAAFADAARPWETGGIGVPELQVDVGAGLAAGLPSAGDVRLDYGRGLRDGQDALTVRWQSPWPAW